MHECNAMQILETKKKNTKTKEQWSQKKSNEAQGPCQKDLVVSVFCIQNFLDAPRALEFVFTLE